MQNFMCYEKKNHLKLSNLNRNIEFHVKKTKNRKIKKEVNVAHKVCYIASVKE